MKGHIKASIVYEVLAQRTPDRNEFGLICKVARLNFFSKLPLYSVDLFATARAVSFCKDLVV